MGGDGVLDPTALYFGANGRVTCGAMECAGAEAFMTGRDRGTVALHRLTPVTAAAFTREAGRAPACEGCGRGLVVAAGPMASDGAMLSRSVVLRVWRASCGDGGRGDLFRPIGGIAPLGAVIGGWTDAERASVIAALRAKGAYEGGGGVAPRWRIELQPERR